MIQMTNKEKQAYEWAMNQDFFSVAAKNAKVLAEYIERNTLDTGQVNVSQVIKADPGSTVQGVKQIIK